MYTERTSSGTDVIDELLEGGLEKDSITTIYGPAGVGKTNLALLAAVHTAKKGKKVIYVDTEGGFSIERLKQITPNTKTVIKKIIFLRPTNFEEQKKAIERLRNLVDKKIGLIVVDTISMLYRLERNLSQNIHEFNRELGLQIGFLSEITRKKKIPVLLTNQVYSTFEENRVNIVGGDILRYSSKCLIELQAGHKNKRKAILRKHRSIPGEKEVYFEIVQEGIRKIG